MPSSLNLLNLLGASESQTSRATTQSGQEPDVQFQSVLAMFLKTMSAPAQDSANGQTPQGQTSSMETAGGQAKSGEAIVSTLENTLATLQAQAVTAASANSLSQSTVVASAEVPEAAFSTAQTQIPGSPVLPETQSAAQPNIANSLFATVSISSLAAQVNQPVLIMSAASEPATAKATSDPSSGAKTQTQTSAAGGAFSFQPLVTALDQSAAAVNSETPVILSNAAFGQAQPQDKDSDSSQAANEPGLAHAATETLLSTVVSGMAASQAAPSTGASVAESTPMNYGQAVSSTVQAACSPAVSTENELEPQSSEGQTSAAAAIKDVKKESSSPTGSGSASVSISTTEAAAAPTAAPANSPIPTVTTVASPTAVAAQTSQAAAATPSEIAIPVDSAIQTAAPAGNGSGVSAVAVNSTVQSTESAEQPFRTLLKEVPAMVEDMRGRIVARPAVHQATLRLDPPSLGRVEISIHFDAQDQVRAVVTADDPSAARQLNLHAGELRSTLAESGIRFEQFNASQQPRSDQGMAFGQAPQGNGQQNARQEAAVGEVPNEADVEDSVSIENSTPASSAPRREVNLTV